MAELCHHTVEVLCGFDHIPQQLLDNAAAELAGDDYNGQNVFDDSDIGKNLCGRTVLALCEQFFRFRVCPDLLGKILNGVYGRTLAGMMIASIVKARKRRKNEGKEKPANMKAHKTRFGVARNLWAEVETIHSTAMCILHSSVDSLQLVVPIRIGEQRRSSNRHITAERVWQSFYCLDTMTGDEVEFASHVDETELNLMKGVVSHNQEVGPNRWQFCLFPTRDAELVSDHFGRDVVTVRRLKAALSSGMSNCVIAAFGAAAFRFMILEFGHKTELPKLMMESRAEKFGSFAPEMLSLEFRDEITVGATPIQREIIRVSMEEPVNTASDVLETLNRQLANPIATRTFWRHWSELVEKCRAIVVDGITDTKHRSSSLSPKILTDTFRNSTDNPNRFTGLMVGESDDSPTERRIYSPLIPPYNPDGSKWAIFENGIWIFEKSGIYNPTHGNVEYADCI